MWRNPLSGRRREEAERTAVARAADVWERAGQASAAVLPQMAKVEAAALKVYADHGLPTRQGNYRRGPADTGWTFLGERLDADQRFALILEKPVERGWRYATLEDIGRFPGAPSELQAASRLLATCRHLKSRLTGREPGNPGDDIDSAIKLGADWRRLEEALLWRDSSRLKLTTPSEALPEPTKALPAKAAAKPKARKPRKRTTPPLSE